MKAKSQTQKFVASTLDVPEEHAALEQQIRVMQNMKDPFMSRIASKNIQEYIFTVTQEVIQSLTAASQTRNLLQKPPAALDLVSLMIVRDRDMNLGRTGSNQDFTHSLKNLQKTAIGNECLLRILFAISSLVSQDMIPFLEPQPSMKEVYQATMSFAAQPLHQLLMQEEAYREALKSTSNTK